ncbi:hypothetical protein [Alkalihalobacillus pseudalcaliphilus]|uniref:AbiTii domain-containing protein n=1 Tax=Alkalihalobacillus pseudalcaliphilus TaxID=79884 RepID=UPI00064E1152|nr:hypothetical protein [Alkalihalobacillus pseudalcaliphilus]KMK77633.1 hypothetical protein AB990_04025 [Alkalihalobacillus pseudalcaliphilus]
MARSQLLKDIVSGKVTLETILLRMKVIFESLNNQKINEWIKGELEGYSDKDKFPAYRIIVGRAVGNFVLNGNVKYTNSNIPLESLLSHDEVLELKTTKITDSIGTIDRIVTTSQGTYGNPIPTSLSHHISKPSIQIINMTIEISFNLLDNIKSTVRSKLVDIVMELEKEFDNLDDYDLSSQVEEDPQKAKQVILNVENIIFDNSIQMGDGNQIKKSKIGSFFSRGKDE